MPTAPRFAHNPRPSMARPGLYRRIPLEPHQMGERMTPTRDLFVLIHLGVPHVDVSTWTLGVGGMVTTPLSLSLEDLKHMPRVAKQTVHQCAGNPLEPTIPTRRVANVEWAGVPLRHLVDLAGLDRAVTHMWSFGMDHGEFAGAACESYGKDLTIDRLLEADALIAYELNGDALPVEHGFPARLVVPGYYGTNAVKWLDRIEFWDRPLDSLFTTTYYNDAGPFAAERKPVWEIPVGSLFTSPAPGSRHSAGTVLDVAGWAWAAAGIARVEVGTGPGTAWRQAELEEDTGAAWRRFTALLPLESRGPLKLVVRATAKGGHCQPMDGARHAAHTVSIDVE